MSGKNAGDRRHRVTFQTRSAGQDQWGSPTQTWADAFTVWAELRPVTVRELFKTGSLSSEVSHIIEVLYRAEFASTKAVAAMRATYGARVFDLKGAMNIDEQNHVVQITASEGLNNG